MTLVLGAGVSASRGLPVWPELLRRTWQAVLEEDPHAADSASLERARRACEREGLPASFIERLDIRRHPLELQLAFERIYDGLRWSLDDDALLKRLGLGRFRPPALATSEQRTAALFAAILRKVLYKSEPRQPARRSMSSDTLDLVARAVKKNAMLPENERRIADVITFNVDDLLERQINAGCRRRIPWAVPIARASALRPIPSPRSIPIYHLHGFIPKDASAYPLYQEDGFITDAPPAPESLVFTDEQYWRTVGNPTGFASRVFQSALRGRCVFVGLSMTDINILRWLANDAIERADDFRRLSTEWSGTETEFTIGEELRRHYWITTDSAADSTEPAGEVAPDLLTITLNRRGVRGIRIPSWSAKEFQDWWRRCFEPPVD